MQNMRKWRNWQTRYLEGVVGNAHAGSIPAFRTILYVLGTSNIYEQE